MKYDKNNKEILSYSESSSYYETKISKEKLKNPKNFVILKRKFNTK